MAKQAVNTVEVEVWVLVDASGDERSVAKYLLAPTKDDATRERMNAHLKANGITHLKAGAVFTLTAAQYSK